MSNPTMKKFVSHKLVEAVKITQALQDPVTSVVSITGEGIPSFTTKPGWAERYKGTDDDYGYFVRYEDGYESWSPSKAFEEGYREVTGVSNVPQRVIKPSTFSGALISLGEGKKLARAGWNGKGMYVELQKPDAHSKMTRPYIFMTIPAGSSNQFGAEGKETDQRVPWLVSQTDLLSEDWVIVE